MYQGTTSQVAEKCSTGVKTCQGTDLSVPLSRWKWTIPLCRRPARSEAHRTNVFPQPLQSCYHSGWARLPDERFTPAV